MKYNKETVNIAKLVEDIKSGEKTKDWKQWCKDRGFGTSHSTYFFAPNKAKHMTCLYTLRALLRGKDHRLNPPNYLRDHNRSLGYPLNKGWNKEEYNLDQAEKVVENYLREKPEKEGKTTIAIVTGINSPNSVDEKSVMC